MHDKQVRRRRLVLGLLVAVSLILLTAYFRESPAGPVHSAQRAVLDIVSPIEKGASRALKPFRDLAGWFGDTLHAKQQLKQVRAQRDRLLAQAVARGAAARENEQLRALLKIDGRTELATYSPLTARVIGSNPTLWYETLQVDRGSDDGVRLNDAVISGNGLVGKVTEVGSGQAQVTLITDPSSGVEARDNRTDDLGTVVPAAGDPRQLLLQYVSSKRIRPGDQIVTSGTRSGRLRSLFPPNIPIGVVTQVSPEELSLSEQVHLKPYVDLRRLDFVQVLTRRRGTEQARVP